MLVFEILTSIILPIFVLIGVGVLVDRTLKPDLRTLTKLNFHVFVPALIFMKIFEADIRPGEMAQVAGVTLVHLLLLCGFGYAVFSRPAWRAHRPVLTAGTVFYNAGNYGIPFVGLAFGPEYIGVIAVVLMVQNLLNFTLGIWLFHHRSQGVGAVLKAFVKVPVIPAILLAVGLRYLQAATAFSLPPAIAVPLGHLSDGLIPVALLTLGVQLSRIRIGEGWRPLSALVVMRLLLSPALALALVVFFGIEGTLAAVLIAAAGLPMAVNVYILASEYGEDAALASQGVFWTTLLSAGTLTLLLRFLV